MMGKFVPKSPVGWWNNLSLDSEGEKESKGATKGRS